MIQSSFDSHICNRHVCRVDVAGHINLIIFSIDLVPKSMAQTDFIAVFQFPSNKRDNLVFYRNVFLSL